MKTLNQLKVYCDNLSEQKPELSEEIAEAYQDAVSMVKDLGYPAKLAVEMATEWGVLCETKESM